MADGSSIEEIDHPAGDFKAAFENSMFFGRRTIREIVDKMDLSVDETYINGRKYKVLHNGNVAVVMSKDPFVDYSSKDAKEKQQGVFKDGWGAFNELRPARSGEMRLIGDKSEVLRAYNLINWRTKNQVDTLNGWDF
jgi:hypothetical protein